MENAIDLESLSSKFQFLELGRRIGEFVSQHPHVKVARLKSAILDLQRRLVGQNPDRSQFAEVNGRAKAEQDMQLEGLRGAIDEVAKKQRHESEKVSRLQEVMGEVRRQMSQIGDAMKWGIGPLDQTALRLAETKNRTSPVESDGAGLRAALVDGSTNFEEVRGDAAGLKETSAASAADIIVSAAPAPMPPAKPAPELRRFHHHCPRPQGSLRPNHHKILHHWPHSRDLFQ
jgi:chromosome segregation ATPase